MKRAEFIQKVGGLIGIAVIAPGLIGQKKFDCPLCEDTGEVVTSRKGFIGDYDEVSIHRNPCPNCQLVPEPVKISPLQEYSPKDWSGLTTRNHLGCIEQMKPLQHKYNMHMMELLSNFGG